MIGWVVSVIFALGMFYLLLLYFSKRKRKKLFENYDDKKDLTRQGELERARRFGTGHYAKTEPTVERLVEPERSSILQATTPNSSGKDSKSTRGFFGKFKHRR